MILLAVDGGNSKTDLALVAADGGADRARARPAQLAAPPRPRRLRRRPAAARRPRPGSTGGGRMSRRCCWPAIDFPDEEERLHDALARRGWAERIHVGNDTFAVLRAGTESGFGIAITCGAGINCVGVGPDGTHVRFPALGEITGDWGGGSRRRPRRALRRRAKRGRPRAEDRSSSSSSPSTSAIDAPSASWPARCTPASSRGAACSRSRPSCSQSNDRGRARDRRPARRRGRRPRPRRRSRGSGLGDAPVEVLVGGGLMRFADARLIERIERGLQRVSPAIVLRRTSQPPIVGAALLALDAVGADAGAQQIGCAPSSGRRSQRSRRSGGGLMADVRYEQATRIYDGTDAAGRRRARPDDRRRRVPRAGRPVGLGQDDGSAHARRARAGRRRAASGSASVK